MPRSATTQTRPMAKRVAQPVDDRQQHADVGRVARPHLGAHRPALGIDHDPQDHLHQLGPVVLGVAPPAERRAAGAAKDSESSCP